MGESLNDRKRVEIAGIILRRIGLCRDALDDIARFITLPDANIDITSMQPGSIEFSILMHPNRLSTSAEFRQYLSRVILPPGTVEYAGQRIDHDQALVLPTFEYTSRRAYYPSDEVLFKARFSIPFPMNVRAGDRAVVSSDPKKTGIHRFFSGGQELPRGRTFYRFT